MLCEQKLAALTLYNPSINWVSLTGVSWVREIKKNENLALYADWDKVTEYQMVSLLYTFPHFFKYANHNRFSGFAWSCLLCHRPEFEQHCDWSLLTNDDWFHLLHTKPEFIKHCTSKNIIEHFTQSN